MKYLLYGIMLIMLISTVSALPICYAPCNDDLGCQSCGITDCTCNMDYAYPGDVEHTQEFTAGDTDIVNVNGQDVTVEVIGVNTQTQLARATVKINGESKSVFAGSFYIIGGVSVMFGTNDQKAFWLPRIASAEILSAGAFTESNNGSNISCMETTAVADGEDWIINGEHNLSRGLLG